ncbi:ABC transporter permease [Treponema sp.]|uniref:ABC transporter permease n=1 Tax=Treponema sp. TaxID=166 RepID=UPI00298D6554|nr:FtsX-like permease family protein [Treponema sp.]MCQ2241052.1 FtsX-like permease family protein [Treponema sp.]
MYYFKISARSLLSKWRQYISLFLVSMFGVAISLFLMFVVDGMLSAMATKAKMYYGGDFQVQGGLDYLEYFHASEYVKKIESVLPKNAVVSKRITVRAKDSFFLYEGTEARFRQVIGIEFDKEQPLFENFNFVEGSAKDLSDKYDILLSEPIAKMLSVHAGDQVTFVTNNSGYGIDTIPFTVKGIFRDSSIFGMYTVYFHIDYVVEFDRDEPDYANRICVYFPDGSYSSKKLPEYHKALSTVLNMYPMVETKEEFYEVLYGPGFEEETNCLVSIESSMEDLQLIIDAMNWVSMLVIVALVVIIIVGVSSTYRVLVLKRINEIGIYKAIGMNRVNVYRILLSETCCLMFAGCVAGLLLSLILCGIIRCINLSFIPAFDVFLTNGVIAPRLEFSNTMTVLLFVFVTTLAAVVLSIRKAVEITPVQALATTE